MNNTDGTYKNTFSFRRAAEADVPRILEIISHRITWLGQKGIDQWNGADDYLAYYTPDYFARHAGRGEIFLAVCHKETAACITVLKSDAPRWTDDDTRAYYLHNLASDMRFPGAGRALLSFCVEKAVRDGMEALRLDSKKGNEDLSRYYETLGFKASGQCNDDGYLGVLWEKRLG